MKHTVCFLLFWACLYEVKAQTKIDSTFGINGVVSIPNSTNKNLKWNITKSLADGSRLVGTIGTWSDGLTSSSKLILSKLTSNGNLDLSFGTNGQAIVYGNKIESRFKYLEIRDIVPLPNGNIFLVGDERDGAVARKQLVTRVLNGNGHAFSPTNQNPITTYFHALSVSSAKLASSGNIVIAGYGINPSTNTQDIFTALLSPSGTMLPFAGQAQLKWTNYSSKDICTDVVLDAEDNIYVAGYTNQTGRDAYCMTAFEANGSALTTFGNGGKVVVQVSQTGQDRAFKAILHPNNTLFLVGASRMTDKVRDIVSMINLTKTGTLNKAFDYDGKAFVFIGSGNSRAYDIKISKDSVLYIAGAVENKPIFNPMVIKMNTKGKLDEAYGIKGVKTLSTSVISDLAIYYNVAIDFNAAGKLLVAGINSNTANGQHVTQFQSNGRFSASFTATLSGLCDGSVSVVSASQEGQHSWSLTPVDYKKYLGDITSELANPTFGVGISGNYLLNHDYFDPNGNYYFESQDVYLDKTASARTIGIDFFPGVGVENPPFYDYGIDLYYSENYQVSANYLYNWERNFDGTRPGFYPISITLKSDAASQCPQILEDTVIVPVAYPVCSLDDTATYGTNLVVNGTFDDATCLPTSFSSAFNIKCDTNSHLQDGDAVITKDFSKYYTRDTSFDWSDDYEGSMDGIEGNYLLLARKTETKLKDKNAWVQKVYVEEGKTYRFKTSIANISHAKLNEYTFPVIFLAVDSLPLSGYYHGSAYGNCFSGYYTATRTGWVTLKLIRENNYVFSKGIAAIDNIEFAEVLNTPQLRTEEAVSESISIFPSPASDMVEVIHVFSNGVPENATIQIVDIFTGREVQRAVAQGNATHLNVANLENGLYIVRLFESNGKLMASSKLAISK